MDDLTIDEADDLNSSTSSAVWNEDDFTSLDFDVGDSESVPNLGLT